MKIKILVHSDSPIRNGGDLIFSQVLKIDFFNPGRILRFSPSSFEGFGCGTSQMIENFFLYRIVYF
jgi:hypothetical protein